MIECILSCPEHGPQFKVERMKADRSDVFFNRIVRIGDDSVCDTAKTCPVCNKTLIRESV